MCSMATELNASPAQSSRSPNLLGPFLGIVTPTSIKIWLHTAEGGLPSIGVSAWSTCLAATRHPRALYVRHQGPRVRGLVRSVPSRPAGCIERLRVAISQF